MSSYRRFKGASLVLVVLLVVAQLLTAGCTPPQQATPTSAPAAQDFFKGKTVTLIVPHGAGGGFDAYARTIAPYIEKYSGATISIKNVTVAGGMGGRNDIWSAPKDGMTIGFSSFSDAVLGQYAGMEGVQFDAPKFTWLALVANEPRVLFTGKDSKFKTIQDMGAAGTKLLFSSPGVGDGDYFVTLVVAQALGWNMTTATGYQNNADAALAVVKGEVDGRMASLSSMAAMLKSGDVRPLLMVAPTRVAEYQNIPTALELAKDDKSKEFLNAATVIYQIDRCFFGPPGMDANRTKDWRAIFDKVLKDEELIAALTKQSRPVVYLPGAEVEAKTVAVAKVGEQISPILKAAVAAGK